MKISVCKAPFWRGRQPRPLREGLTIILEQGTAFATWKHNPIMPGYQRRIPISDELAEIALGATRGPCSYNGKSPMFGYFKDGYTVRDGASATDDAVTVEHCTECGFSGRYEGNPRFRRAMGDGDGGLYLHDERTRLAAPTTRATLMEADWDEERKLLVPSTASGELVVVVNRNSYPQWTIQSNSSTIGSSAA